MPRLYRQEDFENAYDITDIYYSALCDLINRKKLYKCKNPVKMFGISEEIWQEVLSGDSGNLTIKDIILVIASILYKLDLKSTYER